MKKQPSKLKWLWPAIGCLAGYVAALILLTAVESAHPDASIRSFYDAFWYSIVTLSTVGYGDLYPVTALGKLLGIVFVLMSVGLLTFIIGAVVSLFSGRLIPALRLWLQRNKCWYVFSQLNDASCALAKDLAKQSPDALFLFPKTDAQPPRHINCITYYDTMEQAVRHKKKDCKLFFIHEEMDEFSRALAALSLGHPVYCRSEHAPDQCPAGLTLFNDYDCCAQEYWRSMALHSREKTVLIIGDGKFARRMLLRGLLVNVFGPERSVSYHVFGQWDTFRRNHHQLGQTVAIDRDDAQADRLYFHDTPWNADAALLYDADRIILCCDDDGENLSILRHLRRYFPVTGKVHLRARQSMPGETVFGSNEKIYTEELVLSSKLTRAARTMHQIYCDNTNGQAPAWEELTEFLRQSNISAADHLLTKIRILLSDDTITHITWENCAAAYRCYCSAKTENADYYRQIEHLRWMRFHSMYNWRFAPVRDNAARLHPMMVPYAQLTHAEQIKDDFAWELLEPMSNALQS